MRIMSANHASTCVRCVNVYHLVVMLCISSHARTLARANTHARQKRGCLGVPYRCRCVWTVCAYTGNYACINRIVICSACRLVGFTVHLANHSMQHFNDGLWFCWLFWLDSTRLDARASRAALPAQPVSRQPTSIRYLFRTLV